MRKRGSNYLFNFLTRRESQESHCHSLRLEQLLHETSALIFLTLLWLLYECESMKCYVQGVLVRLIHLYQSFNIIIKGALVVLLWIHWWCPCWWGLDVFQVRRKGKKLACSTSTSLIHHLRLFPYIPPSSFYLISSISPPVNYAERLGAWVLPSAKAFWRGRVKG